MTRKAVCLMGPTASGKTDIALRLCMRIPFEIISVDSALVYRGMDIGSAKPDAETLQRTPHRLIDIREPEDAYSAGEFVRDARMAMNEIYDAGRIPLLTGGTMMYFRALIQGIAELPAADAAVRAQIDADAEQSGWPAMHAKLAEIDPAAAARFKPNDRQRIQRALEVYALSGKALSQWQAESAESQPAGDIDFVRIGLRLPSRECLHGRIEERLNTMLNNGFLEEVKALRERPGLSSDASSMRAVGYRQFWAHAAGECSLQEARYRALVATRQLAKRQITWLRSEPDLQSFDPLESKVIDAIYAFLIKFLVA